MTIGHPSNTTDETATPERGGFYGAQPLMASAGLQAAGMSAGRVVGFVRGLALTWLMTPASFGALNVAMTIANVLMPIVGLGLSHGMMRYAAEHESRGTLRGFVRSTMRVALGVAAITSLVLIVAAGPIASMLPGDTGQTPNLIRVVAGCAFALVAFHIVADLLKGLRMFRAVAAMDVASVVMYSAMAVGAAWVWTDNAAVVLSGYGLSSLLLAIFFARGLRSALRGSHAVGENVPVDGRIWRFSLWMMGTAVVWHALQQSGLWYLTWTAGSDAAGTFYAARLFAQLVLWGGLALTAALYAHATRAVEQYGVSDASVRIDAGTKAGTLLVLIGGCVLTVTGPWLLRVFRSEYAIDRSTFDVLVAAFCALAAYGFLQIRFSIHEQSHRSFWTCMGGLGIAAITAGVTNRSSTLQAIDQAAWITLAGAMGAVVIGISVLMARGKRLSLVGALMMLSIPTVAIDREWAVGVAILLLFLLIFSRRCLEDREREVLREWLIFR